MHIHLCSAATSAYTILCMHIRIFSADMCLHHGCVHATTYLKRVEFTRCTLNRLIQGIFVDVVGFAGLPPQLAYSLHTLPSVPSL